MRTLYSIALTLLCPFLFAWFWWRGRHDRRYRQRWNERLALQKMPAAAMGGLVVHAVSVGEVVAATPLIRQLQRLYPSLPITVTCTTPTGSAQIVSTFGDTVHHCYLPLDMPGANQRFLEKLQPRALIILETELWPNLLAQTRKALIPSIVVNARLSKRSAAGYRRFYRFSKHVLADIDLILAQDRATSRRFSALQVRHRPQVCGNLKFEHVIPESALALAATLKTQLAGRTVWVAGSTHAGEDELLIQAALQLAPTFPGLLLVLVPRHPERFDAVAALMEQQGLQGVRRSTFDAPQALPASAQAILVDRMGELQAWYAVADVVFIGGSLIPRGGHNPLEAMCVCKGVQSGPHVHNFALAYRQLEQVQAVNWVEDVASLIQSTSALLRDPDLGARQGSAAATLFAEQSGASTRMAHAIAQYLGEQIDQFAVAETKQKTVWWQKNFFDTLGAEQFTPGWWQQQNKVIGSSTGRNTAWFVEHNGKRMVLRHYYRGGLIAKLSRDRFLVVPRLHSRAMQEFNLLQHMAARGLPVPLPAAARMVRRGFTYQADMLVALVPDCRDLATILSTERALGEVEWAKVGAAIAHMHAESVYHSDLNCHNILLDTAGKVWLIDFDKCGERAPGPWMQQNLDRLLRSLRKERGKQAQFHWDDPEWAALLAGYQSRLSSFAA